MCSSDLRFSSRADYYAKCRPHYPPAVLDILREECGLTPAYVVADIGSGTGLLSELFLANGNRVFAVEPNRAMRQAAERLLEGTLLFTSVPGQAEATNLPTARVDLIAVGQAFHWFDAERAGVEFRRILQPGGWVAIVWNERPPAVSPFMRDYGGVMERHGYGRPDQADVPKSEEEAVARFLGAGCRRRTCPNSQRLEWKALVGRTLSNSRIPLPGQAGFPAMLADLEVVFARHHRDGAVVIEYETKVMAAPLLRMG